LNKLGTAAHDLDDNSWSGPLSGLTWQRSIDALLNYGYHAQTVWVGKRILELLKKHRHYVQNYHPFTGEPAKGDNGYGPTMLAALEYISFLCGVNLQYDKVYWSTAEGMGEFCYTQVMGEKKYTLESDGKAIFAYIDGKQVFSSVAGTRIVTDKNGAFIAAFGIGESEIDFTFTNAETTFNSKLEPNQSYTQNA